jgi:hypothetical protein
LWEDEWETSKDPIKKFIKAKVGLCEVDMGCWDLAFKSISEGILVDRRFSEGNHLLGTRATLAPDYVLVKGSRRIPKDSPAKPYMKKLWDCGYHFFTNT